MNPKVFILATVRNPELLRATTLAFDTLRTGFPNSEVTVFTNNIPDGQIMPVIKAAGDVDCKILNLHQTTIHHEWIEMLLKTMDEPFIILDTDVCFWKSCEWEYGNAALSGRFIPQFFDQFTKCVTRARLHGSFLYFNPALIVAQIEKYKAQFPATPFNPVANLVYPVVIPGTQHSYFHDTCCLLYQAIGGKPFSEDQNDSYDHLNCGTISDIVGPHLKDIRLREAHFGVFENPALAKGVWRTQKEYYAKHAPYE